MRERNGSGYFDPTADAAIYKADRDTDKRWYKDYYGLRYSDAYEVYGLTRTGCWRLRYLGKRCGRAGADTAIRATARQSGVGGVRGQLSVPATVQRIS